MAVRTRCFKQQGPVVRKPINANPRLKVNRGFLLTRLKLFLKADLEPVVKKSLNQNCGTKAFLRNLY